MKKTRTYATILLAGMTGISAMVWVRFQTDRRRTAPLRIETLQPEKENVTPPEKALPWTESHKMAVPSVIFANLFQGGLTTVSAIDPSRAPQLPAGYTVYDDLACDIKTEAIVSGPILVLFSLSSVDNRTVFDNLRVFHAEEDWDKSRTIWVDRTVLPLDTALDKALIKNLPNFSKRTLCARVNEMGRFVIGSLTERELSNHAVVDLKVTNVDSPSPVRVGETLTHTIEVTNIGSRQATEVTLLDVLHDETFVSVASTRGSCRKSERDDTEVICRLYTLAVGDSAIISINSLPTNNVGIPLPRLGTKLHNTVMVKADERDSEPSNNLIQTKTTFLPALGTISVPRPSTQ